LTQDRTPIRDPRAGSPTLGGHLSFCDCNHRAGLVSFLVMLRSLALLVLAGVCGACLSHAQTRPIVEKPDPVVGDMSCAPPMSIHALLEMGELRHEPPPDDAPMHCEGG